MFSFHKPKIYRSVNGCCICRAKSSSSRFTDSKKYEAEFEKCFRIGEGRAGEICNACVLLVKRWKKLPSGTNRHWHHVVDARAGPGTKSTLKLKTRPFQKHKHRSLKKRRAGLEMQVDRIPSPRQLQTDLSAFEESLDRTDGFSYSNSSTRSPSVSDDSDNEDSQDIPSKHSQRKTLKGATKDHISSFLDLTYWKKTEVCCGIIFKGLNDEVLVDPQLLTPCWGCRQGKLSGPNSMKRSQSTDTESVSNLSYPEQDDLDADAELEADGDLDADADLDADPEDDLDDDGPGQVSNPFSMSNLQCGTQQMESLQQQRVISMEC